MRLIMIWERLVLNMFRVVQSDRNVTVEIGQYETIEIARTVVNNLSRRKARQLASDDSEFTAIFEKVRNSYFLLPL